MKYYICEGKVNGKYNASSKARQDVEAILNEIGYEKFFVRTKNGIQKSKLLKILQLITYIKNKYIWNKELKKLKSGDTIIIQYPILNTTIGLENIIKKYSNKINIIALIHDMDSLRYTPQNQSITLCKRVKNEDRNILNACSCVIAHNECMKNKLMELDNSESKIKTLKLFDYITNKPITEKKHTKNQPIIIAGNLSKEKAQYLNYLKDIKDVEFNLYGVGYEGDEENVNYKGAFLPEDLLNHLEGSMGLVWDGISKDTCVGGFGHYLKYNNPHKVSMYLTAGIPIVIWEEAALAKFIVKNNLGYTIKKLDDLHKLQNNITEEDYNEKINNIKIISEKLKNGGFLKDVLKQIKSGEEDCHEKY